MGDPYSVQECNDQLTPDHTRYRINHYRVFVGRRRNTTHLLDSLLSIAIFFFLFFLFFPSFHLVSILSFLCFSCSHIYLYCVLRCTEYNWARIFPAYQSVAPFSPWGIHNITTTEILLLEYHYLSQHYSYHSSVLLLLLLLLLLNYSNRLMVAKRLASVSK